MRNNKPFCISVTETYFQYNFTERSIEMSIEQTLKQDNQTYTTTTICNNNSSSSNQRTNLTNGSSRYDLSKCKYYILSNNWDGSRLNASIADVPVFVCCLPLCTTVQLSMCLSTQHSPSYNNVYLLHTNASHYSHHIYRVFGIMCSVSV